VLANKYDTIFKPLIERRDPISRNESAPVGESAIQRRLKGERKKPLELLKASLSQPAASSSPAETISHGAVPEGMTEAQFNSALKKMMAEAPGKVSITSGKRRPEEIR
jgi:hypothetical protein